MEEVARDVLLKDAAPEICEAVDRWLDAGFTVVKFQNVTFDSSQFGATSFLKIGGGCTYETLEAIEGQHLNDLPSQRQYPQEYCRGAEQPS